MANLKQIRKRISSVKSTQKITRAMKMVAGARLSRAQARIQALRPYAVKTSELLSVVAPQPRPEGGEDQEREAAVLDSFADDQPLLERRPERGALLLVITSDRGLCGAFNTNILRRAEREWREREARGTKVQIATIGRKGRDHFRRLQAPTVHHFEGVWDRLEIETARKVATTALRPFLRKEVDSIILVYNEFKSAMSQTVVAEPLLPVPAAAPTSMEHPNSEGAPTAKESEIEPGGGPERHAYEPNRGVLLEQLVPMYLEISILRALYESMASELGSRMTAMDAATKNASEMIGKLTLQYNRARQAAITTELMEIIGGAEALNG